MTNLGGSKEQSALSAGLDEVGRGSLAGPMTIAVAVFEPDVVRIDGVKDSKKLSRLKRKELAPQLVRQAVWYGLGWVSPQYIDANGISKAWQAAALLALEGIPEGVDLVVDGIELVKGFTGNQRAVPKADDLFYAVSAASIIAKEARDVDMGSMAQAYAGYGWERNSGYGSVEHRAAILRLGVTPYHRRTFLRKLLKGQVQSPG